MGGMIGIEALDGEGTIPAYRAEPKGTPHAAVIVIQEIFGLNPGIRAKTDHWAELGYLALAPDLFWRFAPAIQLDPDKPDELDEAFGYVRRFAADAGVRDVEAAIRWARGRVDGGKVGVVGFCLGGRLAYLAAARTDADVSVGYYGGGIDGLLGEAHAIARPLMLHFGEQDGHITAEHVQAIRAGLAGKPDVTVHTYPGAGHGFAANAGKRRNDQAARQADMRTERLLADTLA